MVQGTMNLFSSGSDISENKVSDSTSLSSEGAYGTQNKEEQHTEAGQNITLGKHEEDGAAPCARPSSAFSDREENSDHARTVYPGKAERVCGTVGTQSAETEKIQKDLTQASIFFCDNKNSGIQFNEEQIQQPVTKKKTIIENSIEFADEESDAGFIADTVEFTAKTDGLENMGQINQRKEPLTIRMSKPKFLTAMADMAKFFILKSKFENGTLVQALDKEKKPLMLLFQLENELMAYRYLGTSLEIEIPDTVGKCPVRYLHPEFLSGGTNILSGVKMQNLKSNFSTENIANISKESIKNSLMGARSLLLPESLTMLPPRLFYHCYALHKIVIPSSVTSVSIDAFQGSGLKHIYFNGECPVGFKYSVNLPKGITIHFKNAHRSSFLEG
jgi:hypothetical protein